MNLKVKLDPSRVIWKWVRNEILFGSCGKLDNVLYWAKDYFLMGPYSGKTLPIGQGLETRWEELGEFCKCHPDSLPTLLQIISECDNPRTFPVGKFEQIFGWKVAELISKLHLKERSHPAKVARTPACFDSRPQQHGDGWSDWFILTG